MTDIITLLGIIFVITLAFAIVFWSNWHAMGRVDQLELQLAEYASENDELDAEIERLRGENFNLQTAAAVRKMDYEILVNSLKK